MSVYTIDPTINNSQLTQTEADLYGSSRIGIFNINRDVHRNRIINFSNNINTFTRGNKFFELTNHLGNVLATISDKKLQIQNPNNLGQVLAYTADIIGANDYYPFGMAMPGRQFTQVNNGNYRYGFNGQEVSTELNDNLTTAEYWEYDSRIGRRWNVDPMPNISLSPYATFSNNPIVNIDPNGDTLSNPQMLDALKIANTEIMKRIGSNHGFGSLSGNYRKPLSNAIDNYAAKNQLNLGDFGDFTSSVENYYNLMAGAAMDDKNQYIKLDRAVINNPGVNTYNTIKITQCYLREANSDLFSFLTISANVAVGESAGAVGTPVVARPKGPQPRLPFVAKSSVPLVEYNGGMSYIYRGDNGSSPLFQLKGGEYKYSSNAVRGLSLHVDAPKLTNARGASYKIMDMPTGLKIVQQGKDAGHFEIVPTSNITQDQFQTLLNKIEYKKN